MARTRPSEYREPRTFMGHPLTPQPRPLSPAEREAATARIEANDEIVANPALLDQLIEANRFLSQMASRSRPARHRILFSGTAQLDATGVWSKRAGDGIGSGALWVYSPNVPLIVIAGTRQAQAPNFGAGVFIVPAATELTLNARTTEWTLYGNGTAGGLSAVIPAPAVSANPAVYTVPAEMTLEAVYAVLTITTAAPIRYPLITIRDPNGNIITQTGQTTNLSGGVNGGSPVDIVWSVGNNYATIAGGNIIEAPIPPLTLQPGSTITVATYNGIQAGDQWGPVVISGSGESLGPSSTSAGAVVDVTMYSDPESGR